MAVVPLVPAPYAVTFVVPGREACSVRTPFVLLVPETVAWSTSSMVQVVVKGDVTHPAGEADAVNVIVVGVVKLVTTTELAEGVTVKLVQGTVAEPLRDSPRGPV